MFWVSRGPNLTLLRTIPPEAVQIWLSNQIKDAQVFRPCLSLLVGDKAIPVVLLGSVPPAPLVCHGAPQGSWGRKGELEHSFSLSAGADCLQSTALAWWRTDPRSKAKHLLTEGLTLFLPAILDAHKAAFHLCTLLFSACWLGHPCTVLACFCFVEKRSRN